MTYIPIDLLWRDLVKLEFGLTGILMTTTPPPEAAWAPRGTFNWSLARCDYQEGISILKGGLLSSNHPQIPASQKLQSKGLLQAPAKYYLSNKIENLLVKKGIDISS